MSDETIYLTGDRLVNFAKSGKAEFKVLGGKANVNLTFKITCKPDTDNPMYFVHILKRDVTDTYAGYLKFNTESATFSFHQGAKGAYSATTTEIIALLYVLNHASNLPASVQVHHLGKCGRCGRTLKDAESIKLGLGPECAKKLG